MTPPTDAAIAWFLAGGIATWAITRAEIWLIARDLADEVRSAGRDPAVAHLVSMVAKQSHELEEVRAALSHQETHHGARLVALLSRTDRYDVVIDDVSRRLVELELERERGKRP